MRIAFVEIQNFRKLKACRVEFAEEETIFVGANNSGKTSAMDALILFLKHSRRKSFATTDFTLSNWSSLDEFGAQWVAAAEDDEPDLAVDALLHLLPTIESGSQQKRRTFTVSLIFSLRSIGRRQNYWESDLYLRPRTWSNSTRISAVPTNRRAPLSPPPKRQTRRCLYGQAPCGTS